MSDGQIIYQPSAIPEQELGFYFENTSGDLKFSKESSDTPETSVWSLTGTVDGATNTASGHTTHLLGKPRNSAKWFALVRIWSPWLAPRQGDGDFSPDKEVVLASFLRQDGYHVVVLALSGIDDVLTLLNHDKSGGVTINARNDSPSPGTARVIVAVGRSFETANSAAMYFARRLVTKYEVVNGQIQAEIDALTQGDDVNVTWLERWYDGLAYCTWNGIGQHLTEDKILEALDSLRKSGVQITNLIIDDNWQSIDDVDDDVKTGTWRDQFRRGWKEFEANKEGFPNGLRATVTRIRREHDNIQHVAVWHALFGYWGGISPDGKIAKEYKVQTVQKKDGVSGGSMIAVSADDVQRFYNDFYSFLRSTGVDSVKTDAQFLLDELVDAPDRHALIREYQDAWSIANLRYFRAKAISCMSQTPQILFHSQMPTNRPRLLVRNSDDFFPDVPASHPWHIFCNAHNALFAQHLNVLPDWDMFQTSHPWASFHAAARCVSGGPIYITDIPGKHDLNLINQISAQTPRGETTILRPSVIGKSMNAYAGFGDKVLLKVGTYVGFSQTGTGILGVFNTTQHPLTEIIRLSDIPGTETGEYVIRSYITGKVTSPMKARDKDALVSVALDVQKWEILSAYAIKEFKLERKHEASGSLDVKVANLGLLGKMTGAAAVINSDMYVDKGSGRLRIWTSLKALGTYGKVSLHYLRKFLRRRA